MDIEEIRKHSRTVVNTIVCNPCYRDMFKALSGPDLAPSPRTFHGVNVVFDENEPDYRLITVEGFGGDGFPVPPPIDWS